MSAVLEEGQRSGSEFPVGSTTITYSAVDSAENVARCSFRIIVEGPPPVRWCGAVCRVPWHELESPDVLAAFVRRTHTRRIRVSGVLYIRSGQQ